MCRRTFVCRLRHWYVASLVIGHEQFDAVMHRVVAPVESQITVRLLRQLRAGGQLVDADRVGELLLVVVQDMPKRAQIPSNGQNSPKMESPG